MLQTVEGIVIKALNYGETHKIITIFSKEIGKFTAICHGANRPRSRFTSLVQPFVQAKFLVSLNRGLSVVQQGEILHSNRNIRDDIVKTAYASYVAELYDKLIEEKKKNLFLFEQLYHTFKRIDDGDEPTIPILMLELKLYKYAGFSPVVDYCIHCEQEVGLQFFSIGEGGLLCDRCKTIDERAVLIPEPIVKLLPIFLNVGIEKIRNIDIKRKNRQLLRQLFDEYYDKYGGFHLRSRRFLKQLNLLEE